MINHLKEIHRELYLPRATGSTEPSFKVRPIDEPYLHTDVDLYLDAFDNPNQSIKVMVSNAGDGTLQVDRIRIPRASGGWVKRGKKSIPTALAATSEPLEIEMKLALKELSDPSTMNVAELHLISNSKRKTFSKVLLRVRPPVDQLPKVKVPEYINFGEISVWRISLTNARENVTSKDADFFLIWHLQSNLPIRFEITEKDDFTFDATLRSQQYQLNYKLNLQKPGVVMPQEKRGGLNLKSFQQEVPIANVSPCEFSGEVTSDTEWLTLPREISIKPYDIVNLPVSLNVEKLKSGRNFGEFVVSNKKIPVWAWYRTIRETALTLDRNQPNLHHVEGHAVESSPLSIEVVPAREAAQTFMIFEDLDFQFPLVEGNRTGYLIGDFNQWTPRTLFMDPDQHRKVFNATLSIPDGTYLFRAEIDGEMRLDPTRLHEVVCCSHGLASKMQIARRIQKVTLRNRSKRKVTLQLRASVKWMRVSPGTVVLPAKRSSEVSIVLQPEDLRPGLNLGWIEMETEEEPKRLRREPIFVMGMINGAVPLLRNRELAFPNIEQGKSNNVSFPLEIFGKGELKGEIQPSTVLHFAEGNLHVQNGSASETMEVTPLVEVVSDKPSNAYRKQCHASLITNCYLANRRVIPFIAKYQMVHLIADPPALYFPKVFLFDKLQRADIRVKRSDGKPIECTTEIPEELTQHGFLKTTAETKGNGCQFVLDPQAVQSAGRFTGILHLKDKRSDMILPIRFATDIIGSQAKIEIRNSNQISNLLSDGILLVITNVGETELRIFDVRFKNLQFYFTPHFTSDPILHAGESIKLFIKVKKKTTFFRNPLIRDTLIVKLNDSQFRNGLFEQEIVVNTQGIF